MEPWGHAFQVYGERGVSLSPILLGIATILEGKKKNTHSPSLLRIQNSGEDWTLALKMRKSGFLGLSEVSGEMLHMIESQFCHFINA